MKSLILFIYLSLNIFAQSNVLLLMGDDVFSPNQLTSLTLWYDASTVTGVTSGNALSQWDDLSSNDNHAVQATGDNQPLWVDNVVNGNAIIRFDGNDFLQLTAIIPNTDYDDYTSFVVMKQRTSGTQMIALATDGVYGAPFTVQDIGDGFIYIAGKSNYAATTGGNQNTFQYFTTTSNTGTLGLRINGIDKSMIPAGISGGSFTYICRRGGDYGDGDIAELLFYNRFLTETEILSVETYLKAKYGL